MSRRERRGDQAEDQGEIIDAQAVAPLQFDPQLRVALVAHALEGLLAGRFGQVHTGDTPDSVSDRICSRAIDLADRTLRLMPELALPPKS